MFIWISVPLFKYFFSIMPYTMAENGVALYLNLRQVLLPTGLIIVQFHFKPLNNCFIILVLLYFYFLDIKFNKFWSHWHIPNICFVMMYISWQVVTNRNINIFYIKIKTKWSTQMLMVYNLLLSTVIVTLFSVKESANLNLYNTTI